MPVLGSSRLNKLIMDEQPRYSSLAFGRSAVCSCAFLPPRTEQRVCIIHVVDPVRADQLFPAPSHAETGSPLLAAVPCRAELLRCIDFNMQRADAERRLPVRFESSSRQRGTWEGGCSQKLANPFAAVVPIALRYVSGGGSVDRVISGLREGCGSDKHGVAAGPGQGPSEGRQVLRKERSWRTSHEDGCPRPTGKMDAWICSCGCGHRVSSGTTSSLMVVHAENLFLERHNLHSQSTYLRN